MNSGDIAKIIVASGLALLSVCFGIALIIAVWGMNKNDDEDESDDKEEASRPIYKSRPRDKKLR